jgi:2-polyprenyl-3-methyl-5-hydroxy-6-metoxy-1,4-benzoquinol methylase
VCGSRSYVFFLQKDGFNLERCKQCGLVQVTDDLTGVNLEDYYGKEFFDEAYMWLQNEGKGRKREYEKFHHRLQIIESLKPERGAILDIGCSFGFFLDVARSRGWEPTGVEIGEYAASFARERLNLKVHISELSEAVLPRAHFDAVTLWNVIEHLDNPIDELSRINAALKEGGLLVFTTSDVDSYLRKIQGFRWRAFIPPIHLVNYNYKVVDLLLKNTGFHIVLRSVALPRESLLQKLKIIDLLRKIKFSDKMMIFAIKKYDSKENEI